MDIYFEQGREGKGRGKRVGEGKGKGGRKGKEEDRNKSSHMRDGLGS